MKIINLPKIEITDFEKMIQREIVVQESMLPFNPWTFQSGKFYAQFENSHMLKSGVLIECYANGNTIDEALKNLCEYISKQVLVFDSKTTYSHKIVVPDLCHTKLLNL